MPLQRITGRATANMCSLLQAAHRAQLKQLGWTIIGLVLTQATADLLATSSCQNAAGKFRVEHE